MTSFSEGDIVRLKSGGPRMTVKRVIGEAGDEVDDLAKQMQGASDGDVVCIWFDGNQPKEKTFSAASVEKAEEAASH